MNFKKIISVFASAAMAAGLFAGLAVTANAEETELKYYPFNDTEITDTTPLTEYQYTTDTTANRYSLDAAGKAALKQAKEGDTLTITYTINATGNSAYRSGFKLANKWFFINSLGSGTTATGAWPGSDGYHLNAVFSSTNTTASVQYVVTLGDNGTPSKVSASLTDGVGKTVTGKDITGISSASLATISIASALRSGQTGDPAKLTDFKVVLKTVASLVKEATPYTGYTNDENLANPDAKGFTAEFTVNQDDPVNSLTWYLKKGKGDWKTLTTSPLSDSGALSGNIKVGLIVYDLPAEVSAEEISAGYTVQ